MIIAIQTALGMEPSVSQKVTITVQAVTSKATSAAEHRLASDASSRLVSTFTDEKVPSSSNSKGFVYEPAGETNECRVDGQPGDDFGHGVVDTPDDCGPDHESDQQ